MFEEIDEPSPVEDEALQAWKADIHAQFQEWLESIDAIPEPEAEASESDRYSVYEELTALRNESRRGNRKSAEVFSQFGESLGQFQDEMKRLREQFIRLEAAQGGIALPRSHCLGLVELLDRGHRLSAALERAPQPGFLTAYFARPWQEAWESLRQGFAILTTHLEKLLEHSGIQRMETIDAPFDPVCMVAVALTPTNERPANFVVEEVSPGYRWGEEILRPAEVKISKPK